MIKNDSHREQGGEKANCISAKIYSKLKKNTEKGGLGIRVLHGSG